MSSERLYYADAYLVEFDAVVREATPQNDRWKIVLNRTAFYPSSGGQPFDIGTLGEAKVVDVFDQEDGTIGHLVDRELEINSRVRGHVDWTRRFDHMQQHTGQHLLSAVFERETGARTVSFHLGTSASTIDLDKELAADQIARVEDAVNAVLWEDHEVCVRFVTAAEAAKLPLRKDPRAKASSASSRYRITICRPAADARETHGSDRHHRHLRRRAVQGRPSRGIRVRRSRPQSVSRLEERRQRQRAPPVRAAR